MARVGKLTLRGRISGLALAALLMGLGIFSWLGVQSVNDSVRRTLDERLTIARIVASHVDETLMYVRVQVENASEFGGGLPGEVEFDSMSVSLQDIFARSGIRTGGIFLVGKTGNILRTAPRDPQATGINMLEYAEIRETLASGRSTVSGLVSGPAIRKPGVMVSAAIKEREGEVAGVLATTIDIDQSSISAFSEAIRVGTTGYTEIVDGNGIVLARTSPGLAPGVFEMSDHPERFAALIDRGAATVGTCHRCHEEEGGIEKREDVLAFAPLSAASWGVAIRQSQEEALSPTRQLQTRFLILGTILLACTLLLVWATIEGIVKPIRMLTAAARKLAAGDFNAAIPLQRDDEIGQLGAAFQGMRQQIARSREELTLRYEAARQQGELRGELLNSVIAAQEEERKRIARELHDEYGQTLTGLIMSIESLEEMTAPTQSQLRERLASTKSLLVRTLQDIRKLTIDLRPSSLDDLGLIPAINAYVQRYPEESGIKVDFRSGGINGRLNPTIETALFRIIQEATHNVVKHAHAQNVEIDLSVNGGKITAIVKDDGQGFDVDAFYRTRGGKHSAGILGIQERTKLLGGTFSIQSQVGRGTRLEVNIPIDIPALATSAKSGVGAGDEPNIVTGESDEKDQNNDRG